MFFALTNILLVNLSKLEFEISYVGCPKVHCLKYTLFVALFNIVHQGRQEMNLSLIQSIFRYRKWRLAMSWMPIGDEVFSELRLLLREDNGTHLQPERNPALVR